MHRLEEPLHWKGGCVRPAAVGTRFGFVDVTNTKSGRVTLALLQLTELADASPEVLVRPEVRIQVGSMHLLGDLASERFAEERVRLAVSHRAGLK